MQHQDTAELHYQGKTYHLPVLVGSEGERSIDISNLRTQTGLITLDVGYKNTGATRSAITFLDGEKGLLRYRGYNIEELAEKALLPRGLILTYIRRATYSNKVQILCQRH